MRDSTRHVFPMPYNRWASRPERCRRHGTLENAVNLGANFSGIALRIARIDVCQHQNAGLLCALHSGRDRCVVASVIPVVEVDNHDSQSLGPEGCPDVPFLRGRAHIAGNGQTGLVGCPEITGKREHKTQEPLNCRSQTVPFPLTWDTFGCKPCDHFGATFRWGVEQRPSWTNSWSETRYWWPQSSPKGRCSATFICLRENGAITKPTGS